VGDGDDFAAVAKGGGVEATAALAGAVGDDAADQRRHFSDLGGDGREGSLGIFDESLAQEEVAGRITVTTSSG
jgi:hypothetical protein